MGSMVMVPCRSYAARTFDGCPACVGAALEAIGQAGLYVLGRTAPELMAGLDEPLEMSYRLNVRLVDETGTELASDEIDARQTIGMVAPLDDFAPPDPDVQDEEEGDRGGMRLEDFQTVLDRIELAPSGGNGAEGVIAGQLFGFDRPIGAFEIEVSPA